MSTPLSPLSALSNILSSGIATIESVYAKHGTNFPSLDEPFRPVTFEDDLLTQTIDHVISAAAQLIMTVKPPQRSLVESSLSVSDQACTWTFVSVDDYPTSFTSQPAFNWQKRRICRRSCVKQARRYAYFLFTSQRYPFVDSDLRVFISRT
jgi:hypothetical protein